MRLITNSNNYRDRMFLYIKQEAINTDVWIASAFFSDIKTLAEMVEHDCTVKLLIRLNVGTSAKALEDAMKINNLQIRYYTEPVFHPKYYIFGDRVAYLGSSNFTRSGMYTNQEMNIEIDGEMPVFEELRGHFIEFWNNASVLTPHKLEIFKQVLSEHPPRDPHEAVSEALGISYYDTLGKDEKKNKVDEYYESFSRRYQEYINSFNLLKNIYNDEGGRKFPELPLRIEVDRFLWWIREYKATGETYRINKTLSLSEVKQNTIPLIREFQDSEIPYLLDNNVPNYLEIAEAFSSAEKISKMEINTLFDMLMHIHAFHDCLRFYQGGKEGLKQFFLENNKHEKIRNTLKYLLFGVSEYQKRVCECIFLDSYKLKGFGESCVKELYGLINKEDVPVSNGRTIKSMEFLGFGKL